MRKITLGFILLSSSFLQAQLTIDNSFTPAQLANQLVQGLIPLNVTFNRSSATNISDQIAKFTSVTEHSIGFDEGIILTTGKASVSVGPNDSSGASYPPSSPMSGDSDLALLSGYAIKDIAALEFDFVATGNLFNLEYIFASEEFSGYIGVIGNDAFAIFLSGPGINGSFSNNGINIAKIPNSESYVSISTLAAPYYVANTVNSLTTQYDGYSVPLSASASLTVGEIYHIKIAIANVSDNVWDSGVFLKAGSLSNTNRLATNNFTENSFVFYPNPAKNQINVGLQNSKENLSTIVIYDVLGNCVTRANGLSSNQASIDVSALVKGVYLMEITTESQLKLTKKLVIE